MTVERSNVRTCNYGIIQGIFADVQRRLCACVRLWYVRPVPDKVLLLRHMKNLLVVFSKTKQNKTKQTCYKGSMTTTVRQTCVNLLCSSMKSQRQTPPNPPQSLSGPAGSAHRALYFSTQWRNGVVFTSRSEILCGALEECLASHLIHWLHSVWMMSHAQKTYIRVDINHTRPA